MPQVQVDQEFTGLRLDKFLCQKFDISFGLAQKLIREKKVKVNEARVDASYKTADEDNVEIFADLKIRLETEKKKPKISAEKVRNFLSHVVYEDENMLAINKPSGLATQGGSGIEISVDDIIQELKNFPAQIKLQETPQLVHRLDKDTSGILLIAKNKIAAEFLTKSFKEKAMRKTYLALVAGIPKKEEGTVSIPLLKKFVGKNEKVYPDMANGKEAVTHYKVLKNFEDYSLMELKPITGRTHQLRVHCKEIGHAVVNDVKYGGIECCRKNVSKRMCLHAYKIELADYFGKKLEIVTELPEFVKKYKEKYKAKGFAKRR